jgi:hypothetical protein
MLISVRNVAGPSFAAWVAWLRDADRTHQVLRGHAPLDDAAQQLHDQGGRLLVLRTDSAKAAGNERLVFWIFHLGSGRRRSSSAPVPSRFL